MKDKFLRFKSASKALTVILIIGILGVTNVYGYDFSAVCSTGQTLYYVITSTSNVEIVAPGNTSQQPYQGYVAPSGNLTIPSTVTNNGATYNVTSIGLYAFYGCSELTSVTIGSLVSFISSAAFMNCSGLTGTLNIPNSVTTLGTNAFRNCTNLNGIIIGTGVSTIEGWAFSGCSSLTSINIPNTVNTIESLAFSGCTNLNTITIGENVTTINGKAFWSCPSLTTVHFNATNCTHMSSSDNGGANFYSVFNNGNTYNGTSAITTLTFGNNVTSIPDYAFKNCIYLQNLSLPNSVSYIGDGAFYNCHSLSGTVNIPNSVISIGTEAFYGCSSINSTTIGEGVTSIGSKAFWNCPSLLMVHFNATNCTQMDTYLEDSQQHLAVFNSGTSSNNTPAITTLTIGNSVTNIPNYAFKNFSNLATTLDIPNSVVSIGFRAFYGSGITSVTIGEGVASIGSEAFWNCPELTSVYFNAINCTSMTTYKGDYYSVFNRGDTTSSYNTLRVALSAIGNNVSNIPNYAFKNCSISTLNIPNSVQSIGEYAFYGCWGSSVTIGEGVTSIGGKAFWNCPSLTNVCFNAINCSQMSTYDNGFYSVFNGGTSINTNPAITTLTFGINVTKIPDYAFKDCTNLMSPLTFPNSVTTIGAYAFSGCSATSLTLSNSLTSIGDCAFKNCTNLTGSLIIPNSVTIIGDNAFDGCSGFHGTLTLGNSLTSIGDCAFKNCTNLTGSLNIPNTVTSIGDYAFSNCNSLSGWLHIPASVYNIGISAFEYCSGLSGINCSATHIYSQSFKECTGLDQVIIGNSVSSIGSNAFYHCNNITNLVIGSSVNNIGDYAFYGCTRISEMTVYNETPATISANSFNGVNSNIPIYIPCGSLGYYQTANYWSRFTNYHESGCTYSITASSDPEAGGSVSGGGTYQSGTTCTLNAIANAGYSFINWTKDGTVVSTNQTYSFTVTENANYIANFSLNSYTITVAADPSVGGNVSGGGTYNHGETCTLSASASGGYNFINWTKDGTVVSTNPTYTLTVTENATYVANFIAYYEISVSANPTQGGNVTGGGTYNQGTTCTIIANANSGYTFVNWTKNGASISSNPSYSFNVTESGEYVANFVQMFEITTSANPTSGGNTVGDGTYSYGSTCTLIASANTGYSFINWTKDGTVVSTNQTYSFTVTENANYIANFSLNSYTITVAADPSVGGNVSGGGTYNHGETCTLSASASGGYNFINWTKDGTVVSANAEYTFTVNGSGNYVAHFSQEIYYTIVALANPEEGGTISGSGTFSQGETCTLTATSNTGYTFVNWTKNGNVVSTNTTYSIVVNETAEYIANFNTNTYIVTATPDPITGGSITGAGTYHYGDLAILTASANDGYAFVNWTQNGNIVSNNLNYSFTVNGNADFVANFSLNSYTITALVNPIGGGVLSGQGNYNYGETATLSITPNDNYVFVNWTENGVVISEEALFSFTVTENRTFIANLIFVDGIDETGIPNYTIYPNPVDDNLYIESTKVMNRCEIYTSTGRLVYKQSLSSDKTKVNMHDLSSGIYIIKIMSDNSVYTRKIVKK